MFNTEKKSASTVAEQKAIILDCLEKNAYIRQTMAKLFPGIVKSKTTVANTIIEQAALDIYGAHAISMSNCLSDIYGSLIGEEVSHD